MNRTSACLLTQKSCAGWLFATLIVFPQPALAQELTPEEEMARKAQDPLADVRALMTDNTIAFGAGPGGDDISFGFQLQPVYSIPNQSSYNMIARAVVPIIGVDPGVVIPPIGPEPRPGDDSRWGLGDIIGQFFFSPQSDSSFKWGIGSIWTKRLCYARRSLEEER